MTTETAIASTQNKAPDTAAAAAGLTGHEAAQRLAR